MTQLISHARSHQDAQTTSKAVAHSNRSLLGSQLTLAKEIQKGLTPHGLTQVCGVDLAFRYQPALWVSGDYCDAWVLDDRRLAFAVGDVSGRGLPAAIVMANMQAALRTATIFCRDPARAVAHVNQHLRRYVPSGMFATLFLGFLDTRTGTLDYINAGHVPPLIVYANHRVSEMNIPADPVLGIVESGFMVEQLAMERSSGILLVTDGVTEATAPSGEQFGSHRLAQVLERSAIASAEQMVRVATESVAAFRCSAPSHDDVTALAILWRG